MQNISINFIHHFFPQQQPSLSHLRSLEELQRHIAGWPLDRLQASQKEIGDVIQRSHPSPESLDAFIMQTLPPLLVEKPESILSFFSEIFSIEALNQLAAWKAQQKNLPVPYQNAKQWAADRTSFCPLKQEEKVRGRLWKEGRRFTRIVLDFLPNLLNTFLSCFKVMVAQRTPSSLWEYYLKFDVISKLALILTYGLVQFLKPLCQTAAKTYFFAGCLLMGGGGLIGMYHQYLRPLPTEILHCTNVDKAMEEEKIQTKIGQEEELNRVISILLTGFDDTIAPKQNNALLVGKSGSGKTSLLQQFAQLKKQGSLPEHLQNLRIFEIDCGMLMVSVNFDHAELIKQIKEQITGHENEVLFFIDGIDHLLKNPAAWRTFRKRFFEDQPTPRFIATTTLKEMDKIEREDEDGSFLSRVEKVLINDDNQEQCRLVLEEYLRHNASKLAVSKDALDAVIELARTPDYLPHIGLPRKAIRILESAIARCEWTYNWASNSELNSPELKKLKNELTQLERPISRRLLENPDELRQISALRGRVRAQIERDSSQKEKIEKIKKMQQKLHDFKLNYYKLTHSVANNGSHSKQKEYLLSYFYGTEAYQSSLSSHFNGIEPRHAVQVTETLVRDVFAASREVDRRIQEQVAPIAIG